MLKPGRQHCADRPEAENSPFRRAGVRAAPRYLRSCQSNPLVLIISRLCYCRCLQHQTSLVWRTMSPCQRMNRKLSDPCAPCGCRIATISGENLLRWMRSGSSAPGRCREDARSPTIVPNSKSAGISCVLGTALRHRNWRLVQMNQRCDPGPTPVQPSMPQNKAVLTRDLGRHLDGTPRVLQVAPLVPAPGHDRHA